ncbi:MAG: CoA transferase [Rhodobacteraceae bacterium]|nr:CoA transferase [Paracoccaceae bacterium]
MGPLDGITVLELAGLGPAPMAGMLLADMGAKVIRVERANAAPPMSELDPSLRGKQSIVLNLKHADGRAALLKLVEKSDVLIEGFRPGVTEKLGIGPDDCWQHNPKLIYGRMTGWGQDGPLAQAAGHDINYISLTGALHAIGPKGQKPVPPLNLVGDMGGGGMLLVNGILAALIEAAKSGQGQVVDAAMVDGAAQLMWMFHGFEASNKWNAETRGENLLDGGAHFYDTYETSDGKYISVGAIEPKFYAELVKRAGLDPTVFTADTQNDPTKWPDFTRKLAAVFKTKTRDEWCDVMEGSDICFAPVLTLTEAPQHPHNISRNTYVQLDGYAQPAPAPRFSRTPSTIRHGQHPVGADTENVLREFGFSSADIAALRDNGSAG